ncbi:MAG: zinc ribbon domain-containing protein [Deltaproteobacteria bacterium]|nr:zinc ribbon domain-containing protein [Deltaproteobacteria bacterium]
MPIYEFICRECGKEFEELVLRAGEGGTCPSCGSRDARKRMSRFRSRSGGGPSRGLGDFGDYGDFGGGGSSGGGSCGGCTASSCAGCGSSR